MAFRSLINKDFLNLAIYSAAKKFQTINTCTRFSQMADTNHAKSKSLTLEMPYVFVEVQDALSVFKINIKAFAMDIDRCYT